MKQVWEAKMAINSINTNPAAFGSVRNLNKINSASSKTQDKISTGLRISSALSSASNFAIGQALRGEIRAFAALNQGLNNTQGATKVAIAGTTALSDLSSDIKTKLVELSNPGNTDSAKTLLQNDLDQLLSQAGDLVSNSSFNGQNLIQSGATDLNTIANQDGDTVTVSAQGAVNDTLTALQGASAGDPATVLSTEFQAFETAINNALGSFGADQRQLQQQTQVVSQISDATEEGLGNIVDADLARESAIQSAQSVQSQLSTLSVGITGNQSQALLGLFR